jgi:hypothetical protein
VTPAAVGCSTSGAGRIVMERLVADPSIGPDWSTPDVEYN